MNTAEFQTLCSELNEKYNANLVTDADVDTFADIISNVLGREDLKSDDTAYRELADNISYKYEKDIQMNPLLARLYEICRMYDNFRERPLTETEAKTLISEKKDSAKHSILIAAYDGYRQLANCWWENIIPTSGTAAKVAEVLDGMPVPQEGSDPANNTQDVELLSQIAACFAKGNAGFDPLDMEAAETFGEQRPIAADRKSGIIEVMDGLDRNRKRKGSIVKIDIRKRTVHMDDYLIYGLDFYRELTGEASFDTKGLPVVDGSKIDYRFDDAGEVSRYWEEMPSPFALPGNSKLVGVQGRVVPVEQAAQA